MDHHGFIADDHEVRSDQEAREGSQENVDVKVILGPRDDLVDQVFASNILETVYKKRQNKESRPILIGIIYSK